VTGLLLPFVLLAGAPPAAAERARDAGLPALRRALASAYRAQRAAAVDELAGLARLEPERRAAWLADADPRLRRAAADVLARSPDRALAADLRAAFLREEDPAVLDALVAALAGVPQELGDLGERVERTGHAGRSAAWARLRRAVACDAVVSKVRNSRVPGFYDGQFSDLWELVPRMAEELVAIAYDDSYHAVIRNIAVMALHETRRPTLERDLAELVKKEEDELAAMRDEALPHRPTALEALRRREIALSRYIRFSLAKAGQTAPLQRMIRKVDDYLAEPLQRIYIEYRGDLDEGLHAWHAEFLRGLFFEVGYYYQQFDDYASAERRYRELIARFPESRHCGNAHYNLACICAIQQRRREALDHLRAAVERGFSDHRWLVEDGDLASLREDPEFLALVELAKSGRVEDAGRDWIRELQRFLPAGTRSFFDLTADQQREVLEAGGAALSGGQRRRLVQDAPAEQRTRLEALLGLRAADR